MKEETVLANLSFAFEDDGSVQVQVQQKWRVVRDDGIEAASKLLPHEAFTLAGATAPQKALLKKALGTAHAARLTELHSVKAALAALANEKDEVITQLSVEKEELRTQLVEAMDSKVDLNPPPVEVPVPQIDHAEELRAQLGGAGWAQEGVGSTELAVDGQDIGVGP